MALRETFNRGPQVWQQKEVLVKEALEHPISEVVTELNLPVYFVMGAYDGMTSPETAEEYLQSITGEGIKEFVLFEESAHYPQFEDLRKYSKKQKEE